MANNLVKHRLQIKRATASQQSFFVLTQRRNPLQASSKLDSMSAILECWYTQTHTHTTHTTHTHTYTYSMRQNKVPVVVPYY